MVSSMDNNNINSQFNQANQAASQIPNLTAASGDLESKLREAVTSRIQSNPIYQQRDQAASNFISSGPQIRADLANTVQQTPLSPSQQAAIESSRRASSVIPLTSLNDLVGSLTGGVENAVSGGLGAFNSLYQSAIQRAESLRQAAQDAYNRQVTDRELALREASAGQSAQPSLLEQILLQSLQNGGQTAQTQVQVPSTFVPDQESSASAQLDPNQNFIPIQPQTNFFGNLSSGANNALNTVGNLIRGLFSGNRNSGGGGSF